MKANPQDLKNFLQDVGLVSFSQWKEMEKEAKTKGKEIEDMLLEKEILTPEALLETKAHVTGIPFINLEKAIIEPEVLELIPEKTAQAYKAIAYHKSGKELEVALLDPNNLQALDFLQKKTGLRILPRLTTESSIQNALKQYDRDIAAEFSQLIPGTKEGQKSGKLVLKGESSGVEGPTSEKDLQKIAENVSTVKVVDSILRHAMLQNASDIHIEPLESSVVVRFRIDGILHDIMKLPKPIYSGLIARVKVLSNLKLDEHRLPQDGRFKIETDAYKFSVRVSVIPVMDGEKIVMRLLKEESKGLTLETLGLGGAALESVGKNIKRPNGLILVTGPTGSGKTTTLYAIMDILNTAKVNISTIEDPIEYRMPRINQTQVKPQINLTFANGLRSLLRQDPDIIMVGEIRDNETAGLAINAALTGHLVLSTLHTNSAAGALPRLLDMGVEPFLIASTVNLIIAQRLVRKLCSTKEKYQLTKEEVQSLNRQYDCQKLLEDLKAREVVGKTATWESIPLYRPKASAECSDGYKGRIGIFEVLEISSNIQGLITKEAPADQIHEEAAKNGMVTMFEDGIQKAVEGTTSLEEILRVTKE